MNTPEERALEAAWKACSAWDGKITKPVLRKAIEAYMKEIDGSLVRHMDLAAAAQRIFEVFCGGPVDWSRHVLNDADDNIFASSDWAQAMLYAEAALSARPSQETNQ